MLEVGAADVPQRLLVARIGSENESLPDHQRQKVKHRHIRPMPAQRQTLWLSLAKEKAPPTRRERLLGARNRKPYRCRQLPIG
jgi:hypothetical protein